MKCPLCFKNDSPLFYEQKRSYYRCQECQLIFVPRKDWVGQKEEKAIYDLHENDPDDLNYRKFLSRLTNPLLKRIPKEATGLDFGCGEASALGVMLKEEGHQVLEFDKFYANNLEVLERTYDFITATEVLEHLQEPAEVIELLLRLLKKNAPLGIMTKLARDLDAFKTWHYKNDQTHICFFSIETFKWLSSKYKLQLEFIANDVVILSRPS